MANLSIFDLTGRKAIVTGACSGLGKGMAEGLLEAGASVAVIDFNKNVTEIADSFGARGYFADVTDFAQIKKVFDQVAADLGGLDILVNSAGMTLREESDKMDMNNWRRIMSLNVYSVMHLCKLAANIMIPQRYGKILNMASMTSYFGVPYSVGYSTSKGAVMQMTKSLADEWAQYGIRVNALAPGYMDTPLCSGITQSEDQTRFQQLSQRIPVGRWGRPEDLKGTAVFLCSEASEYVNGAILPVDGGFLGR